MTVQKFITYDVLDRNGQIIDNQNKFELQILDKLGNYLVHKDLLRHQINQKQGTVATKTRGEVRGGGRKPWRQKGTGRARAGSNRSPLWKGGGVIFGPKPRKKLIKLNQKERKLAIRTLLYNKRKSISVVNDFEILFKSPKTKVFLEFCEKYPFDLKQKTLIIVSEKTAALKLATRNLKNVELISASTLNTLSLLKSKQIILTPLSLNLIKEIYCD